MAAASAQARLDAAVAARQAGSYAEALDHHLWFHERVPAEDDALSGVRLSFALGYWAELARDYPPAMDALRAAGDRPRERLLAGAGDWDAFCDVAAVDRVLGEPQATHELFRRLDARQPALAHECGHVALPTLVEQGDHELARRYLGDPAAYVRRHAEIAALTLEGEPAARVVDCVVRRYARRVRLVLDVLVAVGENDAARGAREQALAAVEAAGIRAAVAARLPAAPGRPGPTNGA